VVLSLAALNPPRQVAGPVTEKNDACLIRRATAALGVHGLEVDQGHIGAVGLEALRAGVDGELEALGRAGRLEFLLRNDLPALVATALRCRERT